MRNQNKLLIEQLDRKLKPFIPVKDVQVPPQGWVRTIRTTLNMTLSQLGRKLNMTTQGVQRLEQREAHGAVSIKTLKGVAKALDMQFVYGFVPNEGSIEKLVDSKARKLAIRIVMRTNQNMKLEKQGTSDKNIEKAVDELADEIKREMRKSLWD